MVAGSIALARRRGCPPWRQSVTASRSISSVRPCSNGLIAVVAGAEPTGRGAEPGPEQLARLRIVGADGGERDEDLAATCQIARPSIQASGPS